MTDLEEDIYVGVLVEEGDVIKELADLLSSPYDNHTPHFHLYYFTLRSWLVLFSLCQNCESESVSLSVVSNSYQPQGL